MSSVELRLDSFASPARARSLLTVRAAISSAVSSLRPRSTNSSLMCSYCRSRLLLHACWGIVRLRPPRRNAFVIGVSALGRRYARGTGPGRTSQPAWERMLYRLGNTWPHLGRSPLRCIDQGEDMTAPAPVHRRLWVTAGSLTIAFIVLTFTGVVFQYSLELGQSRQDGVKQLVETSLSRNYVGGYIEYVATLVLFVGLLLVARLLRGTGETTGWLSSCMNGSVVAYTAVTVAAGFAAGAAALYDAHHGASLATATAVNDIRNFSFFLSEGLIGTFLISAGVAGRATRLLPRWLCYAGIAIGAFSILAIPGARIGLQNVSIMLWFVWLLVFGVVALRSGGRTSAAINTTAARVPATV